MPGEFRMRCLLSLLFLASLSITAGCGGANDGPPRYHVSGSVSYAGKPIPAGTIMFEPAPGNSGPAGYAKIVNGRYDTRSDGAGAIAGPHQVRIAGFDGQTLADSPQGLPLFEEYTTKLDLPKEATTHDFEIPSAR